MQIFSKIQPLLKITAIGGFNIIDIGGLNTHRGPQRLLWGENKIENEITTIKLLRVQIFSKIWQLLKITHKGGVIFLILGGKNAPQGGTKIF